MKLLGKFGACDSHSHVFGPFAQFPLSSRRAFDPPESPLEELEKVWRSVGADRAVLVQGSAHGGDHSALLAALARSPETRRGVALLTPGITEAALADLDQSGIRAVRFNWIHRLLSSDWRSEEQRLSEAADLLERLSSLKWHVEIHIDIDDLDLVTRLSVPQGMPVVIDHMARIDLSAPNSREQLARLLRVLERDSFWVKMSGADRLAENCEGLAAAVKPMRLILEAAPGRCVWGLDWPHVNLARRRSNVELAGLLLEVAGDEEILERVLVHNPAKLYRFDLEAG